jgi:hypothetical protein
VNLRHGVEHGETKDQCTAGVGTLLLEFGMLSHLSGMAASTGAVLWYLC